MGPLAMPKLLYEPPNFPGFFIQAALQRLPPKPREEGIRALSPEACILLLGTVDEVVRVWKLIFCRGCRRCAVSRDLSSASVRRCAGSC